jgi:hypothetical protein
MGSLSHLVPRLLFSRSIWLRCLATVWELHFFSIVFRLKRLLPLEGTARRRFSEVHLLERGDVGTDF